MTTPIRRSYFRRNVGDPGSGDDSAVDVFTNTEVDALYGESDIDYVNNSENVKKIATVVLGYEALMADAIKQVTFLQNDSRIDASDLPKMMLRWMKFWQAKLNTELEGDPSTSGSVRTGVTRRIPSRQKEFPDA